MKAQILIRQTQRPGHNQLLLTADKTKKDQQDQEVRDLLKRRLLEEQDKATKEQPEEHSESNTCRITA